MLVWRQTKQYLGIIHLMEVVEEVIPIMACEDFEILGRQSTPHVQT